MTKNQSSIIFIKASNSSFIVTDQKILEKHYNVIPYLIKQGKAKQNFALRLLALGVFLISNRNKSKVFVTWFGDYHAAVMVFIGRLFRKTTIIFAGGQEAICYKELGKGVYLKKIRGFCVKYALRNASLVLPNHQSLIYHENYFYNSEHPHIDGIKHYVPNLRCKIEVIPNGIDPDRIHFDKGIQKLPNRVLTVGTMNKMADFYNKGFDLFIEVARRNPDLDFVLISIKKEFFPWIESNYKTSEIKNLNIIPSFCPDDLLSEHYNKSKVYVQASITEGMPVSLSEAMLCECIPVGSNVNGIPDAIGPHGIIIYQRKADVLELAIRKALTLDSGKDARQYTIQNYSILVREKKMVEVFGSVI